MNLADNLTIEQRRRAMSKVKQRDTAPELIVRSLLHRMGYRFRKNVSSLPSKPDIVLPKFRAVIFVHGCFWHQHEGCRKSVRPLSNIEFWNQKLDRTMLRDKRNLEELDTLGWRNTIIWECQISDREKLAERLSEFLHKSKKDLMVPSSRQS